MANGFVRVEFVKRSNGKNVCAKSAYISRDIIHFQGNKFQEEKVYNWSSKEAPAYHKILLPSHAKEELNSAEVLWNLCEKFEGRKNSQPAFEMVLALPDDRIISKEDKVILLNSFVEKQFVDEGFAAEVAIHQPDTKNGEDHNWHAHVLVTGRKIADSGDTLEDKKPRAFFADLFRTKWHELWTQHQNEYFEEKGLSLRVDPFGIVPQKHLGPFRMRGRIASLLIENESRKDLNEVECSDPQSILEKITESKSSFTPSDVDRILHKYLSSEMIPLVRKEFWSNPEVVELLEKETGERTFRYTTKSVMEEEAKIVRIADRLNERSFEKQGRGVEKFSKGLNIEQRGAFTNVLSGRGLACIDGHAGTGKSYLLKAIHDYYISEGRIVRALGPDNATARILRQKGMLDAQNIYKFLFSVRNQKQEVQKNREVWIIDESGKIGNEPLLELLKLAERRNVQIVFSGSTSQLSSVQRGCGFQTFCDRYGSQTLVDIQRQKKPEQREIAKLIAQGNVSEAIDSLNKQEGIHWFARKQESMEHLINMWADGVRKFPVDSSLIVARTNQEVRVLNEMAREERKKLGQISGKEYECETMHGTVYVSEGDRIVFRKTDKTLGLENGQAGILVQVSENMFILDVEGEGGQSKRVKLNPQKYRDYQLGYATTVNSSQGATVTRSYILYHPGLGQKEFYVNLTRHERRVDLFVSHEEVSSISHLKLALARQENEISTTEYVTVGQLLEKIQSDEQKFRTEGLKNSDRLVDRLFGRGKDSIGNARDWILRTALTKSDRKSEDKFYDVRLDNKERSSCISEVPEGEGSTLDKIKIIDESIKRVIFVNDERSVLAVEKIFPGSMGFKIPKKDTLVSEIREIAPYLRGRETVIWLDNNEDGYKTTDDLARQLRRTGGVEIKKISTEQLSSKFPIGWNPGSEMPTGKTERDLKEIVLNKPVSAVNSKHVLFHLNGYNPDDLIQQVWANEVVWRVDERLRGELEEKFAGNAAKVKEGIIDESVRIFLDFSFMDRKILSKGECRENQLSAYRRALHVAENGKEMSPIDIKSEEDCFKENKTHESSLSIINNDKSKQCAEMLISLKSFEKENLEITFEILQKEKNIKILKKDRDLDLEK